MNPFKKQIVHLTMHTESGNEKTAQINGGVWFVYDGDCPICRTAAHALRIRQSVGHLHLVNAREDKDHPVLREVNARGMNLDDGMVLKYENGYYHGEDALHMMALLGSNHGWFNRINAVLFRSKTVARICYPLMRASRNALLRLGGVQKIRNLTINPDEPLFKRIFGEQWDALPPVMQEHYSIRPFSDDTITLSGYLDVTVAPYVRLMARLTDILPAYSEKNVAVMVRFTSNREGAFCFHRTFHYKEKGDVSFNSRMEWIKNNELVEFIRFGIGWRLAYHWDGEKVILSHRGYVWRILGLMIPVPLAFILGKGHAEEVPLSEDRFRMWTHTQHALLGKTFGYAGEFRIIKRDEV